METVVASWDESSQIKVGTYPLIPHQEGSASDSHQITKLDADQTW